MKYLCNYKNLYNDFNMNERNTVYYRGFHMYKNIDLSPGANGYWSIPKLYHREFANKISQGYDTVSITQGKEAIDEWYDFNIKVNKFKYIQEE